MMMWHISISINEALTIDQFQKDEYHGLFCNCSSIRDGERKRATTAVEEAVKMKLQFNHALYLLRGKLKSAGHFLL